jgi:hypothetical protein
LSDMADQAEPIWENDFSTGCEQYYVGVAFPYDRKAALGVKQAIAEVIRGTKAGFLMEREQIPEYIFADEKYEKVPRDGLPDFFWVRSFPIESERVRALFERFEIGTTRFHEVPIYDKDHETLLSGLWYVLNFVADVSCFSLEDSEWRKFAGRPDTGYGGNSPRKYLSVGVKADEIGARDMWADPMLRGALFFSDRMKRAVEAANLSNIPDFRLCKIAE